MLREGVVVTGGLTAYDQGVNIAGGVTVTNGNVDVAGGLTVLTANLVVGGGGLVVSNGLSVSAAGLNIVGGLTVWGGTAFSGTFNGQASDRRLKYMIEPLSNSLEVVSKLRGVYFSWKQDIEEDASAHVDSKRHIGVIAQEVHRVLPDIVDEIYDGRYTRLSSYLFFHLLVYSSTIQSSTKNTNTMRSTHILSSTTFRRIS